MKAASRYAAGTTVLVDKTISEIRALITQRYEATNFALIENGERFGIAFEMHNRRVRFVIPLPQKADAMIVKRGYYGKTFSQEKFDQLLRERWRATLLVIKAKLESVESGIESFDAAFMAQLILPSGQTMEEWASPQMETLMIDGAMPPLLPSG